MSDFYNKYPYTDFHELNLDWIIERVKQLTEDWASTEQAWKTEQEAFNDLHDYVMNYFDNLNVQTEINNKLDTMASDGTLDALLLPYFNAYTVTINNTVATQNQTITIKHEAHSRALFAEGALAAAEYLVGKDAGLHDMKSIVGAK